MLTVMLLTVDVLVANSTISITFPPPDSRWRPLMTRVTVSGTWAPGPSPLSFYHQHQHHHQHHHHQHPHNHCRHQVATQYSANPSPRPLSVPDSHHIKCSNVHTCSYLINLPEMELYATVKGRSREDVRPLPVHKLGTALCRLVEQHVGRVGLCQVSCIPRSKCKGCTSDRMHYLKFVNL